MRHDLADVLRNPLRFATEKARNMMNDPASVPFKTIEYARYDLVRALNRLVDVIGLGESRIERLMARAMAVPVSRFLRMRRSVSLLVSETPDGRPGHRRWHLPEPDPRPVGPRAEGRPGAGCAADQVRIASDARGPGLVRPADGVQSAAAGLKPCPTSVAPMRPSIASALLFAAAFPSWGRRIRPSRRLPPPASSPPRRRRAGGWCTSSRARRATGRRSPVEPRRPLRARHSRRGGVIPTSRWTISST